MKFKLTKVLFFMPMLSLLFSCERTAKLDIMENEPVLVVEGLITNLAPPYYVHLSTTTDLNAEENSIAINDAVVKISNDDGEEELLTFAGDGAYQCDNLQGTIGTTYFLEITWQDQIYSSESTMLPIGQIDSLNYVFKPDDLITDEGYYVTYFGQKSDPSTINYYRWLISLNGKLLTNRFNLFIESDEFVSGLQGLEFDIPFSKSDTIGVQVYSLDMPVYNYYEAFGSLVNNDGGIFSISPENPPSNVSNGAFGLFQASAINSESIIIK